MLLPYTMPIGITATRFSSRPTSSHTALPAVVAPAAYTVTDLGTLGGTRSVAYGINGSGQVTGYSFHSDNTTARAFL